MGLGGEGVLEEDHRQHPALRYLGPDLQIPSQGPESTLFTPSPVASSMRPPVVPVARRGKRESSSRCRWQKATISSFLASWAMRAKNLMGALYA